MPILGGVCINRGTHEASLQHIGWYTVAVHSIFVVLSMATQSKSTVVKITLVVVSMAKQRKSISQ